MPRYKLTIEYDGTPFAGWQWQDNAPSVQRALKEAIEAFSGEQVMVQGAGRVKILRSTKSEGRGAPGEVLDGRLTIACGEGAVRIVELQKAGGKPMQADEFLRGIPVAASSVLA